MNTLRHAIRQLSRRPATTTLSIGLLALGVGLAASFYSVLDSALLSGLPFPEGDRLVAFSTRDAAGWPMPLDDYRQIEAAQRTFEWTVPLRTFNTMVTRGDNTKGFIGSYITADLFARLGVEPALGRGFAAEDEDSANPPVALISHRLWHGSYGADPAIIGEEITLNREPTIVVGVMPPGFQFPLRHDVWGVFGRQGREWSDSFVFGFGKLARGAGIPQARNDLARITALLDESSPQAEPRTAALESFVRANIGDRARGALRAMVFAALGLLLLTCANLANLRLSESLRRRSELDTRLALGSGPIGLVKLLLVENLVLGLAATALALGLAFVLVETLGRSLLTGGYLARIFWIDAELDLRAAGFAVGCALLASLLGALAPIVSTALRLRTGQLGAASGSRTRTASWSRHLVGLQVGLCFALLVAAGLFSARARDLLGSELGFRAAGLSSTLLSTYQADLAEVSERGDFVERFHRELRERPEIIAAAYASSAPWGHVPRSPIGSNVEPDRDTAPLAGVLRVSTGFFETLQLSLQSGRDFTVGDSTDSDLAIVSRSLAERLFDDDALDRTLVIGGRRRGEPARRARVIGVAADLGINRTDDRNRNLSVYLPQNPPDRGTYVLVRRQAGIGAARPVIESVLERLAPLVGTLDELSVDQALSSSTWVERRLAQIFSLFGVAALLLTAGGMYAVIAVMVRGRERELGIRAAVGARPRDLQQLVLSESGRQLLLGMAAGAAALWAGRRLLDQVLIDSLTWQPGILLAAAGLVTVGCLAATCGPTRRAARTDPTRCLHSE